MRYDYSFEGILSFLEYINDYEDKISLNYGNVAKGVNVNPITSKKYIEYLLEIKYIKNGFTKNLKRTWRLTDIGQKQLSLGKGII